MQKRREGGGQGVPVDREVLSPRTAEGKLGEVAVLGGFLKTFLQDCIFAAVTLVFTPVLLSEAPMALLKRMLIPTEL